MAAIFPVTVYLHFIADATMLIIIVACRYDCTECYN
ncbi:hypothetical protein R69608_07777 [Paraburkholderia nemoris]|uniref:Uncharacterized protein n=1 Tax=Paraburkholderia nemoris TaxID=2793076 RepID=A0ABM8T6F3_9BURK|nr:hypothetical protein R69619_07456 [Paraburkholderia nemoris]CAE6857857.1 hypothetical protein R75777_07883 [Paraburkholderia nemoris]CAE6860365.1 hypothetical protein R69776_07972 [Paraburkholderia nemoris]CAE6905866.1 hypothetical protein R69749_08402 [Paraburkholderia domus]CAE6972231.1 hypothetical protein R69608_07777 [Paraburkholderia nemoris]